MQGFYQGKMSDEAGRPIGKYLSQARFRGVPGLLEPAQSPCCTQSLTGAAHGKHGLGTNTVGALRCSSPPGHCSPLGLCLLSFHPPLPPPLSSPARELETCEMPPKQEIQSKGIWEKPDRKIHPFSPVRAYCQVPDYNHFSCLQLCVKAYDQGEKKTRRKYTIAICGYTKVVELQIFFFYFFCHFSIMKYDISLFNCLH